MSNKAFKQKAQYVKPERVKKESSGRVKRLFASLFNNQAAFDGGRFEPGWIAGLLFAVSIVVALIPAMVLVGKTKGSDNLNGSLYHTEVGMVKFVEKLDEQNVDLKVVTDGTTRVFKAEGGSFADLVATDKFVLSDSLSSEEIPYYSFIQPREISVTNEDKTVTTKFVDFEYLRVYYTGDINRTFLVNTTIYNADRYLAYKLNNLKSTAATENVTSYLIIGRDAIFSRIYNPTTITNKDESGSAFEGRVKTLPLDMNIRDFGKKLVSDGKLIDPNSTTYTTDVLSNFAAMQDAGYKAVKTQNFWMQTGIYAAIFVLIGLIMGLIIFISTRGKHNAFRDVKFFQAMKVGAWLLPTPALLTLVVGLLMPNYFSMAFIMALGIRSVWLTMRTLGPQQQPPQK